jgi:cytochrome c biogenesis protein CcmG/thiol:disulfide interchange protein DsbE
MKALLAAAALAAISAAPAAAQTLPDAFAALGAQAAGARANFARIQARDRAAYAAAAAPAFSARALDGRTLSVASFRGRPVLLNFWATWSGPSFASAPAHAALAARYGAAMVGVAVAEDEQTARVFLGALPADARVDAVLMDQDQSLFRKFGGQGLPLTVVLGRDGAVVAAVAGASPDAEAKIEAALRTAAAR